jgi:hypothetical protein
VNNSTPNADIRKEAEIAGVKMWQIAAKLGIHQCTFSTWLRFELSDELKAQIRTAIHKVKEES